MPEIRPYYFTDDEIDFILRLIRNSAEFDHHADEREYMKSLANGIEDQIVNHPENN